MEPGGFGEIAGFIPLFIFGIPFAIGNYFLAKSMDRSIALWVILSLVPVVNIFFFYFVAYVVILFLIRRLNEISNAVSASPASP